MCWAVCGLQDRFCFPMPFPAHIFTLHVRFLALRLSCQITHLFVHSICIYIYISLSLSPYNTHAFKLLLVLLLLLLSSSSSSSLFLFLLNMISNALNSQDRSHRRRFIDSPDSVYAFQVFQVFGVLQCCYHAGPCPEAGRNRTIKGATAPWIAVVAHIR